MNIELFLSILHDKIIPNDLRITIDSIDVDIPTDYVMEAAQ